MTDKPRRSYRVELTVPINHPVYYDVEKRGEFKFERVSDGRLLVAEGMRFSDGTYTERWFYEKLTLSFNDDEDTGFGPSVERKGVIPEVIHFA